MEFNTEGGGDVMMDGCQLKNVYSFKYLGSIVSNCGSIVEEIRCRMQAAWNNWKRTSGVLCDRRISARVNGKIYKAVVRPALVYASETWAIKKAQERKIEVA